METETKTKPIPAKELHKYVWIMVGVFTLVAASFPIALMRVSKEKKFAADNFHLKSLTPEGKLPTSSTKSTTVVPVANNSPVQNSSNSTTTIPQAITPARQSKETVIRWNRPLAKLREISSF